jgi:hypothetical protein
MKNLKDYHMYNINKEDYLVDTKEYKKSLEILKMCKHTVYQKIFDGVKLKPYFVTKKLYGAIDKIIDGFLKEFNIALIKEDFVINCIESVYYIVIDTYRKDGYTIAFKDSSHLEAFTKTLYTLDTLDPLTTKLLPVNTKDNLKRQLVRYFRGDVLVIF